MNRRDALRAIAGAGVAAAVGVPCEEFRECDSWAVALRPDTVVEFKNWSGRPVHAVWSKSVGNYVRPGDHEFCEAMREALNNRQDWQPPLIEYE